MRRNALKRENWQAMFGRGGAHGLSFPACALLAALFLCGCSLSRAGAPLEEADGLFIRGDCEASLREYEKIRENHPQAGDRALFEMGIIHAHPGNDRRDYAKALDCFEKLIRDYPASPWRHESERMVFHIRNVTMKDDMIDAQQARIRSLEQEAGSREGEIAALRKKIAELEGMVFSLEKGPADKVLIEKKKRRLMLIKDGKALKSYRIALGENPDGPKERQGDNRTPEGFYVIDARNRDSRYHLSLRISYPNGRDRKRARALGVSPGGDIMIHGIRNGFSAVGDAHTGSDWTNGCIAVTDGEIEEIERLVPDGTIVEIRP